MSDALPPIRVNRAPVLTLWATVVAEPARLPSRDRPDPRSVRRRAQRLRPHERAALPSRQHQAVGHAEQSTPPRERAQVDARENLRPSEQLDTFVDSRAERTIRLKFCRQSICGVVIRIQD
jgi:hypothetical protein